MNTRLEEYKKLIDALVKIRPCVLVQWVKDKGWPQLPENEKFNQLLDGLTPEEKDVVAQMIQQARDGGIHDTLAYLTDEININGLRISRNGVDLAVEPYGTSLYYDWVCRREGDEWPEQQLEDEYKSNDYG